MFLFRRPYSYIRFTKNIMDCCFTGVRLIRGLFVDGGLNFVET